MTNESFSDAVADAVSQQPPAFTDEDLVMSWDVDLMTVADHDDFEEVTGETAVDALKKLEKLTEQKDPSVIFGKEFRTITTAFAWIFSRKAHPGISYNQVRQVFRPSYDTLHIDVSGMEQRHNQRVGQQLEALNPNKPAPRKRANRAKTGAS